MKQRLTLYLIIFMVAMYSPVAAQLQAADSSTGIYVVNKKKERVSDIAKKLKTDAILICSLNNITSVDSVLTQGQKIIVRSGIKNGSNSTRIDTIAQQPVENRKEVLKSAPAAAQPTIDTELIQSRILLTDATLDLNRTLLQGIEASLDSLNVKDKSVIDEKNISLTIHRMQRQRDKAMLTPVLMHMQDSLKTEIKKEEHEKEELENTLNGAGASRPEQETAVTNPVVKDSVLSKSNDTQPVVSAIDTSTKENVKDTAERAFEHIDTEATAQVHDSVKQTMVEPVHVKPVIEAGSATSTPVMHWETAKAIYYNDGTGQGEQNENELTAASTALNSDNDTAVYLPGLKGSDTLQLQPGSEEARAIKAKYFYTRALKYINQKNFNQAVSYLKKSIDLAPKYYDAWLAMGETDAHLGLYTKALNEFRYCETMDSNQAVLFYKMGIVELKLKQKTEALNDFNRSLKLNPEYIPSLISRAHEYADRNQFKAAIKGYNEVLQIDPSYHTMYKYRALAEYALKNYTAAIDDFSRYLIFNEADGSVYYHRGMARLEQKEKADACTDFSVSAKLGYRAASKALYEHCK